MGDRGAEVTALQRLIDRILGRPGVTHTATNHPDTSRPLHRATSSPTPQPQYRPPSHRPSPPAVKPDPVRKASALAATISWGSGGTSRLDDPLHFIGQTDPLEGTSLTAGETITICTRCGVGYHLSSMSFVRSVASNRCVSCKTVGQFENLILVAGASATMVVTPAEESKPAADFVVAVNPVDADGRPIIQLHQVRDYIGEDVAFEGRILNVRLTGGGAHFLYFERAARVLDGFRAVIRPRDLFFWEIEGVIPADDYPDQWVRIVGKIVDDPRWQLEMVIQRPEAITIINEPTQPAGWSPTASSARAPIAPAPRPRVRWMG